MHRQKAINQERVSDEAGVDASPLSALAKPEAGRWYFSSQIRCSRPSAVTTQWSGTERRPLTCQERAEGLALNWMKPLKG